MIFSIFRFFAPTDSRFTNIVQTIHQWKDYLFSFQMVYIFHDPYDWFCAPGSHILYVRIVVVFWPVWWCVLTETPRTVWRCPCLWRWRRARRDSASAAGYGTRKTQRSPRAKWSVCPWHRWLSRTLQAAYHDWYKVQTHLSHSMMMMLWFLSLLLALDLKSLVQTRWGF